MKVVESVSKKDRKLILATVEQKLKDARNANFELDHTNGFLVLKINFKGIREVIAEQQRA